MGSLLPSARALTLARALSFGLTRKKRNSAAGYELNMSLKLTTSPHGSSLVGNLHAPLTCLRFDLPVVVLSYFEFEFPEFS